MNSTLKKDEETCVWTSERNRYKGSVCVRKRKRGGWEGERRKERGSGNNGKNGKGRRKWKRRKKRK